MAELLFLLAFFAPPVVVVLMAGAVAMASIPHRAPSPARTPAHAVSH